MERDRFADFVGDNGCETDRMGDAAGSKVFCAALCCIRTVVAMLTAVAKPLVAVMGKTHSVGARERVGASCRVAMVACPVLRVFLLCAFQEE